MNAIFIHRLWLIYTQLKEAESDPWQRLEILEHSREELGLVLNELYDWSKQRQSTSSMESKNA